MEKLRTLFWILVVSAVVVVGIFYVFARAASAILQEFRV